MKTCIINNLIKTKRERLKSALYIKLKKFSQYAQDVFSKKPFQENSFETLKQKLCLSTEKTKFSSGFFKYVEKFLAEAGTQTRHHLVPPKSINVCTKEWYIHGELCGPKRKKTSHCNSRAFFLRKQRLKTI